MGELPGRCHLPASTNSNVNFCLRIFLQCQEPSFLGVRIWKQQLGRMLFSNRVEFTSAPVLWIRFVTFHKMENNWVSWNVAHVIPGACVILSSSEGLFVTVELGMSPHHAISSMPACVTDWLWSHSVSVIFQYLLDSWNLAWVWK